MEVGIMNKTVQTVTVVLCGFVIFGMIAFSANTIINMPHVVFDQNDNCVEVFSPDPTHYCGNLPRKYTHDVRFIE